MCEDYVNLVADLMYPKLQFGPFGYNAEQQQVRPSGDSRRRPD